MKERPSIKELEEELKRENYRCRFGTALRNTVCTLVTVAAAAVLVATLLMPVLRIYGTSMSPTLQSGEIVISVKSTEMKQGDIVAFYYNNKVLIKRVIAGPADWVNITGDGRVYVNDEELQEPYLTEKAVGECDIQLPYQVPDGKYFLMGDSRSVSLDSRSELIGCVSEEQIVGKLVFRLWPFNVFGWIE